MYAFHLRPRGSNGTVAVRLIVVVFDALVLAIILSSRYLSLRHWLSSCVYDQKYLF